MMDKMLIEQWGDGKQIIILCSEPGLIGTVRKVLHESPVVVDILELSPENDREIKFLYRHSKLASKDDIQGLNEYLEALIRK